MWCHIIEQIYNLPGGGGSVMPEWREETKRERECDKSLTTQLHWYDNIDV